MLNNMEMTAKEYEEPADESIVQAVLIEGN